MPSGPVTLDEGEFDAQFQLGARILWSEALKTVQYQTMVCRKTTDDLGPGRNADEHDFVKRRQIVEYILGLVQGQIKTADAVFTCLHTRRQIENENLPVAACFRHGARPVRMQ